MRAKEMELLAVGAAPATQVVLLGRASKPITPDIELLEDEELEVELDAELVLDELEDTELLLDAELVLDDDTELLLDAELVLDELEDTELLLDAEELDELIDD